MNMIVELSHEIDLIVLEKKTTSWKNSWMWDKDHLKHYFLICTGSKSFKYQDIDDVEIEIRIESDQYYRIDIKSRYKTHNFWLFKEIHPIL